MSRRKWKRLHRTRRSTSGGVGGRKEGSLGGRRARGWGHVRCGGHSGNPDGPPAATATPFQYVVAFSRRGFTGPFVHLISLGRACSTPGTGKGLLTPRSSGFPSVYILGRGRLAKPECRTMCLSVMNAGKREACKGQETPGQGSAGESWTFGTYVTAGT